MQTTIKINARELNQSFIDAVQSLFQDKSLSITVKVDMDETDYLNSSETMKKRLESAIEKFRKGDYKSVELDALKS